MDLLSIVALLVLTLAVLFVLMGLKIVPQSDVFVVERFGKYTQTLTAGVSFIVPLVNRVAHKVSVLERQLPEFTISVITKDNVEVDLKATVFFRVIDAAATVYRIRDIDKALFTAATSIVRSAAGRLELDALQSSRESMNEEISANLGDAASVWGIEVTRTEVTDIMVDEQTKEAQRQQLNAERQRRAQIAAAEGAKRSTELAADARLYEAQRAAEAIRVQADADAYSIKISAEAEAEQTRMISEAINNNGQAAIEFEVLKRQVDALSNLAASGNAKTLIMPTDVTKTLGSLSVLADQLRGDARGARGETP